MAGAGRLTTPVPPRGPVDLELHELDERAFYVPRTSLLDSLLEDCSVAPAIVPDDSAHPLQGYALARSGARATYMGPVIALGPSVATTLLDSLLDQSAGPVFLDAPVTAGIAGSLAERGFSKQRNLTRMSLGARMTAAASDWVFAIAGPELG